MFNSETKNCPNCNENLFHRIDTPDRTFWWCQQCGTLAHGYSAKHIDIPKQSQWHKYPDQKPKHSNPVLVKLKNNDALYKAYYLSGWYVLQDNQYPTAQFKHEHFDNIKVTQWIELPQIHQTKEIQNENKI